MSLAGALPKLGQQPADLRGARLVALHQPRDGISLAAGKLQTVHGLDSPHGKQPLAIQIHKGWFAPDGHSFKNPPHHLLQAASSYPPRAAHPPDPASRPPPTPDDRAAPVPVPAPAPHDP